MKTIHFWITVCLFLHGLSQRPCHAQARLNGGFEQSHLPDFFLEWGFPRSPHYQVAVDTVVRFSGTRSFLVRCLDNNVLAAQNQTFFNLDSIPPALFKGIDTIRVSAWIRIDSGSSQTHAYIYANIRGGDKFNLKQSSRVTASQQGIWKEVKIVLPVRDTDNSMIFGGLAHGPGKIWFDHFQIMLDDIPLKDIATLLPPLSRKELKVVDNRLLPVAQHSGSFKIADDFFNSCDKIKIIGLGEGTHGTHEFSNIKNHIIQEYARRSRQKITIVFETPFGASVPINNYIVHGVGNISSLMKTCIARPFQTREVSALIEWARNFNVLHSTQITFAGIDMQWPDAEIDQLIIYGKNKKNFLFVNDLLALRQNFKRLKTSAATTLLKLDSIESHHLLTSDAHDSNGSMAIQHIQVLKQFVKREMISPNKRGVFRDSCMAVNASWLAKIRQDATLLVWAHNSHVKTLPGKMGNFLKASHPEQYKAVGFATSNGSYTAYDNNRVKECLLPATHPETYEYWFERQKYDSWILHLDPLDNTWMDTPRLMKDIGAFENKAPFYMTSLRRSFNYIIYVKNTTPAQPLSNE